MTNRIDMLLEYARFCVNCETITNSPDRCLRCGGPVEVLSRWLTRPHEVEKTPEPVCVTYRIARGMEYDEDQSVAWEFDARFPTSYMTSEAAEMEYAAACAGHSEIYKSEHTLFTRLAGVVSVWAESQGLQTRFYCIVQIMPKSS